MGSRLIPGAEPASALPPLLERQWLLVGIGNDMRGDDAFGPLLARRVQAAGLPAFDGGMAPENVTGPILRAAPELLLLADATDLGAEPGTVRLIAPEDLAEGGTSTHDPSLVILLSYLRSRQADLEVRLLVAQAGSRALGDAPSRAMLATIEEVARLFGA